MSRRLLLGALLLSLAFGALHAFGVLLEPLQAQFAGSRAAISAAYSLAIVCLTIGVFLSGRLASLSTARRALLFGLSGAAGLALAACGLGLAAFLAGYGIVFGLANGLAYALFLDRAAASAPGARGLAVGAATATYGLGAVLFAALLAPIAARGAPLAALWLMAATVAAAGGGAALLFTGSAPDDRGVAAPPAAEAASTPTPPPALGGLWLAYFLAAFGGLMVIAHAMAIMTERQAAPDLAQLAPALNAAGNVAGSILGGWYADRAPGRRALAVPLLVSVAALAALLAIRDPALSLVMLTACGMAYGALIAAVPVVIRNRRGPARFADAFGRVFTAWGAAGLAGPLLAGALFDLRQGYDLAIGIAGFSALGALLVVRGTRSR